MVGETRKEGKRPVSVSVSKVAEGLDKELSTGVSEGLEVVAGGALPLVKVVIAEA